MAVVGRCKAFFDGLEVPGAWSMTRSHGTSPDVGQLVFRIGGDLPSSFIGDLVLTIGDDPVVTFYGCLLKSPTEQFGNIRNIIYQIADRRWRWKWPRLFGQYNVRDSANQLITGPGLTKNARELAALALDALQEPYYDVSALPIDANLAPHVIWHYEPAAMFLEKLCAMFGCSVQLMNDNSVKIVTDNTGAEPDDTGLMYPVESGIVVNVAPDYITAYAGDTHFESWLTLEPIMTEVSGQVKPAGMMSYAPPGGWRQSKESAGPVVRNILRPTETKEFIEKAVEMVERQYWRMWRITGFPKGMQVPPGTVLQAPVGLIGDLPNPGVEGLYYVVTSAYDSRVFNWINGEYVGFSYTNLSTDSYRIVDVPMIAGLTDPVRGSAQARYLADDARTAGGWDKAVICDPGETVFDARLILPLLQTRLGIYSDEFGEVLAEDEVGKNEPLPAEICGYFVEDSELSRNKDTNKLKTWLGGIKIDTRLGHIWTGKYAFQRLGSTGEPPFQPGKLYLRCGYVLRQSKYGNVYHRRYDIATGNDLGIANGVVDRTDVHEYRIANYAADYNDLSQLGTVITNTTAVDEILYNAAMDNARQYFNLAAPRKKQYTPIRAIDTNGYVMQVSYSGGDKKPGETMASCSGNFDRTMPPAYAKRQRDLQAWKNDAFLMSFRNDTSTTKDINWDKQEGTGIA